MKTRWSPARCCCGGEPTPVFDCSWMPPGDPDKFVRVTLTNSSGTNPVYLQWNPVIGWNTGGTAARFTCLGGIARFQLGAGSHDFDPANPNVTFTQDPFTATKVDPAPGATYSLIVIDVIDAF